MILVVIVPRLFAILFEAVQSVSYLITTSDIFEIILTIA